jgi:hypothetical protein
MDWDAPAVVSSLAENSLLATPILTYAPPGPAALCSNRSTIWRFKKMKKFLACTLAILLEVFAPCSHAAPPSDASLDELFKLTKVEALLNDSLKSVDQNMNFGVQQMLAQYQLPPAKAQEATQKIAPVLQAMSTRIKEELTWTKMRPRYVELYKKTFSQEDVDGMIGFYKTPAGQSTIDKLPKLMQEIMVMTQQLLAPLMAGFQTDIQKALTPPQGAPVK